MAPDVATLATRLAARDPQLWPSGNVSGDRLGWLVVPSEMRTEAKAIDEWAGAVRDELGGAVLFGMGGSSLAPEVLRVAARRADSVNVLDTTHPTTVRAALDHAETAGWLAAVASKSGTTIEPNSMLAAWRARIADPRRVAAITDPGTSLDQEMTAAGGRAVFRNRADIGGRYSALSLFGIVPAALLGYDLTRLLDFDDEDLAPGVELGLHLAAEQAAGRDKVTVFTSRTVAAFGLWVEQLLAESTGKRGTGLIPVAGEGERAPIGPAEAYGPDRTFVVVTCGDETIAGVDELEQAGRPVLRQHLSDADGLGELFFRWEVATAIAGAELGIDPFDEPDVAAAKAATNEVLAHWPNRLAGPAGPDAGLSFLADQVRPGDYVALLAYLPYGDACEQALARLQAALRNRHHVAVTRGFGPRYLHSTGQLHKGGPPTVVAVQLLSGTSAVGKTPDDVDIPDQPFTFGRLIAAQAMGDFQTLSGRRRRVVQVDLGNDPVGALEQMAATVEASQ